MKNLLIKIYKLHSIKSFLLLFLLTYIVSLLVGFIFVHIGGLPTAVSEKHTGIIAIISTCVIIPLFETFVCQYLIFYSLDSLFRKKLICNSVISGIIFGALHAFLNRNIVLFMLTASIGFLLQLWFILLIRRHGDMKAFGITAGVHALHNLIAILL